MLEKLVGDTLEVIGECAFKYSYFLKEINLRNVKEIGEAAFYASSLKTIKNNHILELKNY